MKDRIPTKILENGAIRYGIYNEDGSLDRYEYMILDDEPSEEGTPLNKANLLSDATAERIWPLEFTRPDNPTVDDAFRALSEPTYRIGDVRQTADNLQEPAWLLTDGRAISSEDYPVLYNMLRTNPQGLSLTHKTVDISSRVTSDQDNWDFNIVSAAANENYWVGITGTADSANGEGWGYIIAYNKITGAWLTTETGWLPNGKCFAQEIVEHDGHFVIFAWVPDSNNFKIKLFRSTNPFNGWSEQTLSNAFSRIYRISAAWCSEADAICAYTYWTYGSATHNVLWVGFNDNGTLKTKWHTTNTSTDNVDEYTLLTSHNGHPYLANIIPSDKTMYVWKIDDSNVFSRSNLLISFENSIQTTMTSATYRTVSVSSCIKGIFACNQSNFAIISTSNDPTYAFTAKWSDCSVSFNSNSTAFFCGDMLICALGGAVKYSLYPDTKHFNSASGGNTATICFSAFDGQHVVLFGVQSHTSSLGYINATYKMSYGDATALDDKPIPTIAATYGSKYYIKAQEES